MRPPPKRRIPGGQTPPPPVGWAAAAPRSTGPATTDDLGAGADQDPVRPWSPGGQVELMGRDLRDWRRGSAESPAWIRAVGWTIVAAFLVPLALGAIFALTN